MRAFTAADSPESTIELITRMARLGVTPDEIGNRVAREISDLGGSIVDAQRFEAFFARLLDEPAGSVWLASVAQLVALPNGVEWPHRSLVAGFSAASKSYCPNEQLRSRAVEAGCTFAEEFAVNLVAIYGLQAFAAVKVLDVSREIWSGAPGVFHPPLCTISDDPELLPIAIENIRRRGTTDAEDLAHRTLSVSRPFDLNTEAAAASSRKETLSAFGGFALLCLGIAALGAWLWLDGPARWIPATLLIVTALMMVFVYLGEFSGELLSPTNLFIVGLPLALAVAGLIGLPESDVNPSQGPASSNYEPGDSGTNGDSTDTPDDSGAGHAASAICDGIARGLSKDEIVSITVAATGVSVDEAEGAYDAAAGMC